jgi:hypothetical protein
MLTLAQCREQRLDIYADCHLCNKRSLLRWTDCNARFDNREVRDLFEEGRFQCPSHKGPVAAVYVHHASTWADENYFVEAWPAEDEDDDD